METRRAFTPSTNGTSVFRGPRIDDFGVIVTAYHAMHAGNSSALEYHVHIASPETTPTGLSPHDFLSQREERVAVRHRQTQFR